MHIYGALRNKKPIGINKINNTFKTGRFGINSNTSPIRKNLYWDLQGRLSIDNLFYRKITRTVLVIVHYKGQSFVDSLES